ncbi:MAG: PHP domain-containing protein [Oscillospiraceae bacterium]|nr:PHP domain-containing protein [Oscillospiraceae bacterium]
MYLISPRKNQYKANLHCHSTNSDGKLTPEQLKNAYKSHGYSILSITDHEVPRDYSHMTEKDFLMLTGYEAYIRPDPNCTFDIYVPETHLNLFARDPHNEAMVCYNASYCKYHTPEQREALVKVGSQRTREYTLEYINEFIRTARENGYLVSYNHPVWSMESEERILAYEGCFSMEMCNYGSLTQNNQEYNGPLYDKLLRSGKRIFVHSADDNHNSHPFGDPKCDSFGGATMILADELSYGAVVDAMEKGEMYSTMGPIFKEVSFDGETVHIECSEVAAIHCHFGSKFPASVRAEKGEHLTRADLKVGKACRYVRISIRDEYGNYADTRGFFRDELGLPPLE